MIYIYIYVYIYVTSPYETKYQLLLKILKGAGLKHCNDSDAFIEYSNDMDDVYKNIDDYYLNNKRKVLFVFDNMIADIIRGTKLNSLLVLYYSIIILQYQKILD